MSNLLIYSWNSAFSLMDFLAHILRRALIENIYYLIKNIYYFFLFAFTNETKRDRIYSDV